MRIIFMGSPEFAVPTLNALVEVGHEVVAAYTQPPRPAGRGKGERPTAVETRARQLGIEVRSPRNLGDEAEQAAFDSLKADIAVVAAYGLILPQAILDTPRLGCLNVHASLLPKWRGAAPVQRAIMAGDTETGVTIMQMEAGLDTGPMLHARELPIGDSNAAQLTEKLAKLGASMMVEVLADLSQFPPERQAEEGSYARKIGKGETRINWESPATIVHKIIQGMAPFPGAWFAHDGHRIKLLAAELADAKGKPGEVVDDQLTIACGTGALRPILLQRAGRLPVNLDDFLRGYAIPEGTRLI